VEAPGTLQAIVNAPFSQRRTLLADFAVARALRVLGLNSSHTIRLDQPLRELGLDSLMAVELRNLIASGLGLNGGLPATLLFDYPTIESVVDYLLRDVLKGKEPVESQRDAVKTEGEKDDAMSELDQLSEEDAEVLLLRELESHAHFPNE
jgi:acyl carrier protein